MSIGFGCGVTPGAHRGISGACVAGISLMNVAMDRARLRSAGSPETANARPICIHASTASVRVARA